MPIVVLTSSLQSPEARRARAAGAVALLADRANVDVLVGEVDTLIATASRTQRMLTRRLLDLQELARHYSQNADGQAQLRGLIDHLQVAILAVDEQGHCIAASHGATALTGYSRQQLRTSPVFQSSFAGGPRSDEGWPGVLGTRPYAGTTTITNRAGEDVTVHAAAVADIMPGVHLAAFAAA